MFYCVMSCIIKNASVKFDSFGMLNCVLTYDEEMHGLRNK